MEERNNNVPVNGNKSSMIPGVPAWGSVQYGDGERIEEQFAESEPSKTSSSVTVLRQDGMADQKPSDPTKRKRNRPPKSKRQPKD